jgi:TolB-like protein/class 3 adenylate cyclase
VASQDTERRLAAIMFTDIVGYTALMARDEEAGLRARERHRQLVRLLVEQHHGESIEARGDESLSLFPSALDAVRCALAIHGEAGDDVELSLHLGIHLGDVVVHAGEVSGDGVNIASRICSLSEGGGLCVSGEVYQAVRNQPDIDATALGEHELKNVGRPVAVYRVTGRVDPPRAAEGLALPGMDELTVPGFSGRPAIAVLPFDNLSEDAEQEYFSDGITEDLITRLSAWRWFPVIARNSTSVYKGKAVDVKRVSRELGVRYVVEGSVRKIGDRVRITAQLIDATTGHHVWAERYDRELKDVFALQDEITEAIAASMNPELRQFETERTVQREPRSLDAWECAHRGWWHLFQRTEDRNARARSFYEEAIRLDPQFVWAYYGLALTHYNDVLDALTQAPDRSTAEMVRAAQRCIALDDKDPFGHLALGLAYSLTGRREEMLAAMKLAVRLNPSLATAYRLQGNYLALCGQPDEAIASIEKGMRLSPQDPQMWNFLFGMSVAHFAASRYEAAIDWALQSRQRRPNAFASGFLAASYALLGRIEEARSALGTRGLFTVESVRRILPAADPDVLDRLIDGLRKAGMQE